MRYGYRRITVLLRREGWHVKVKRVHRLYRLEGLHMRPKPPRRRVIAKLRDDRTNANGAESSMGNGWHRDGNQSPGAASRSNIAGTQVTP
jgi:putative transposase